MTNGAQEIPVEQLVERLEQVDGAMAALFNQPQVAERLRSAPDDAAWSAMQIVGHMVEMIPYWLSHCTAIVAAGDGSHSLGRSLDSPERLAGAAHGAGENPQSLLAELHSEILAAATTIRNFSAQDWNATGAHIRDGAITVRSIVERFVVSHAEEHLAQVRKTLQA